MTDCSPEICVLLLCRDLMMTSSVSSAAANLGCKFRALSSIEQLADDSATAQGCLLLIDLAVPGLNLKQLSDEIPPAVLANAIAYGPHVHKERMVAAADAGIGTVLSRGQFHSSVQQLISDRLTRE